MVGKSGKGVKLCAVSSSTTATTNPNEYIMYHCTKEYATASGV